MRVIDTLIAIYELWRDSIKAWIEHGDAQIGASLAFYTIISIAPLLIVVVMIVGSVFGEQAAQSQIIFQVEELVGVEGARYAQEMLSTAARPSSGWLPSLIGLGAILFAASTIFSELRRALDKIWHTPPHSRGGVSSFFISRGLALAALMSVGFLLIVSLVASAAIAAGLRYFAEIITLPTGLLLTVNSVVSLLVMASLFMLLYRILPSAKIRWRYAFVGGLVTAILFNLGKYVIGLYLGNQTLGSVYGAAGSLVVVLIWVYYSAQIVLLGAEFTWQYHIRYGEEELLDDDED